MARSLKNLTLFQLPETDTNATEAVRMDLDLVIQINEIARKCMLTRREVLSRIVRDALPYVKVVERKVYEMVESGKEEEPDAQDL